MSNIVPSENSPLIPSDSSSSSSMPPRAALPQPQPQSPAAVGNQIRFNFLRQIRNIRFSHVAFCVSMLVNIPQITAVAYVLSTNWHPGACDKPLLYWCLAYAIRLVFVLALSAWPVADRSVNVLESRYQRLSDGLNMLGFSIFVCGNLWIMNAGECESNASAVYQLSIALLAISYIILLLPCLLLMFLAPLVFFCLPLLIRMPFLLQLSSALQIDRGAPDVLINRLESETFETGSIPAEDAQCSICLQEYVVGEKIRRLPCQARHHFHQVCIDNWLRLNDTCPCDRQPIVRRQTENEQKRDESSQREQMQQRV